MDSFFSTFLTTLTVFTALLVVIGLSLRVLALKLLPYLWENMLTLTGALGGVVLGLIISLITQATFSGVILLVLADALLFAWIGSNFDRLLKPK